MKQHPEVLNTSAHLGIKQYFFSSSLSFTLTIDLISPLDLNGGETFSKFEMLRWTNYT